MPAKKPKAAVDALVARLPRVASCITDQPVLASGHRPSPQPYAVTFAALGRAVSLRAVNRNRRLSFFMAYEYRVVEVSGGRRSYQVQPAGYRYRLLDTEERELLAYHWHPVGPSSVTYPHLHLSGRLHPLELGGEDGPIAFGEIHLPTGFVTLADVVRLLIAELAVVPRRSDWPAVLQVPWEPN